MGIPRLPPSADSRVVNPPAAEPPCRRGTTIRSPTPTRQDPDFLAQNFWEDFSRSRKPYPPSPTPPHGFFSPGQSPSPLRVGGPWPGWIVPPKAPPRVGVGVTLSGCAAGNPPSPRPRRFRPPAVPCPGGGVGSRRHGWPSNWQRSGGTSTPPSSPSRSPPRSCRGWPRCTPTGWPLAGGPPTHPHPHPPPPPSCCKSGHSGEPAHPHPPKASPGRDG